MSWTFDELLEQLRNEHENVRFQLQSLSSASRAATWEPADEHHSRNCNIQLKTVSRDTANLTGDVFGDDCPHETLAARRGLKLHCERDEDRNVSLCITPTSKPLPPADFESVVSTPYLQGYGMDGKKIPLEIAAGFRSSSSRSEERRAISKESTGQYQNQGDETESRKMREGSASSTDAPTNINPIGKSFTRYIKQDLQRQDTPDHEANEQIHIQHNLTEQYESMMKKAKKSSTGQVYHILEEYFCLDRLRTIFKQKRMSCVRLNRIVHSKIFSTTVSSLIVANVLCLIIESDLSVGLAWDKFNGQDGEIPAIFEALDRCFAVAFTIELLMRLIAEELTFFAFGDNIGWNYFDSTLVLLSIMQLLFFGTVFDAKLLRIIRVLRMSRALRILRLFEIFHELRIMLSCIVHIIFPLFWSVLTLSLILIMFSMVFMNAIDGYISEAEPDDPVAAEMFIYFSSAPMTILSLFACLTNGQSWWYILKPLRAISDWYTVVFVCYIVFLQLGVLNIITSIFVTNAHSYTQTDLDTLAMQDAEHNRYMITQLREVFDLLDNDDSGHICLDEFETWTSIDRVAAFFENVVGLEAWKAARFFRLLDINGDEKLEKEEFVVGCMRLKGGAKNLDQEVMTHNLTSVKKNMQHMKECMFELHDHLAAPGMKLSDHNFDLKQECEDDEDSALEEMMTRMATSKSPPVSPTRRPNVKLGRQASKLEGT